MARHYNQRPSEILGLDDGYIAYCFDEVCYYYLSEVIDDDGKYNWSMIKWSEDKAVANTNKEFIEHVEKFGAKR